MELNRENLSAQFPDNITGLIRPVHLRNFVDSVPTLEEIEALSFSGYSGATGSNGASGYSGYSGVGISGYSGFSGQLGTMGSSGYSGYSGKSGSNGNNGVGGISGYSGYSGLNAGNFYFIDANFTKTNTTLANITGSSFNLTSGTLASNNYYKFRAYLQITCNASSGHKYAVAMSGSPTCQYTLTSLDLSTKAYTITTSSNSMGTAIGITSSTSVLTIIEGYVVGNGNSLSVQFGLNAGTTSGSVLAGSSLEISLLGQNAS